MEMMVTREDAMYGERKQDNENQTLTGNLFTLDIIVEIKSSMAGNEAKILQFTVIYLLPPSPLWLEILAMTF